MTLNELEQRLSALKSEQDKLTAELEKLKAEQSEVKPWRADYNAPYYFIRENGMLTPGYHRDERDEVDNRLFRTGNYYRTRELAEQDAKELALRGRIRQLRDALCEGYDFKKNNNNCYIYLDKSLGEYKVASVSIANFIGEIYFDTKEHAQTACDILNAERNKEDNHDD